MIEFRNVSDVIRTTQTETEIIICVVEICLTKKCVSGSDYKADIDEWHHLLGDIKKLVNLLYPQNSHRIRYTYKYFHKPLFLHLLCVKPSKIMTKEIIVMMS